MRDCNCTPDPHDAVQNPTSVHWLTVQLIAVSVVEVVEVVDSVVTVVVEEVVVGGTQGQGQFQHVEP